MKADINIPKEALEAAAQAIFDASPFREAEAPFREQSAQYQALTRAYARAAIRDALAAWPGMATIKENDRTTLAAIYLPLPLPKSKE